MSRRRNGNKPKGFGMGKHRKARIARFAAKHPDSKKNPKNIPNYKDKPRDVQP